jgi:cellulose synthase/poly-beta-1,6-N-acetylglucosamine synthase-like glycosyltransferase
VLSTGAGYPIVLFLASRARKRPPVAAADRLPSVSVVIAAHNEQACIREKVRNTLALDYPAGALEVILASDASTDGTEQAASEEGRGRIRVVRLETRAGKTAVQNEAVRFATGELLVFTDADARLHPAAVRRLAAAFGDPAVGAASGWLSYAAQNAAAGAGEDIYWAMESALWSWEARAFGLLLVVGPLYAVRRSAYIPPAPDAVSDLAEPLLLRLTGWRVVLVPDALGTKPLAAGAAVSLRRKSRVILGGMSSLLGIPGLAGLARRPALAFQLLCHKILRWLAALLVPLALPCAVIAAPRPLAVVALAVGVAGACAALIAWASPVLRRRLPLLRVPGYACLVSAATWRAFIALLAGRRLRWWTSERV